MCNFPMYFLWLDRAKRNMKVFCHQDMNPMLFIFSAFADSYTNFHLHSQDLQYELCVYGLQYMDRFLAIQIMSSGRQILGHN